MVNLTKQVAIQRRRVLRQLLIDRCTVYPVNGGNMVINAMGIPEYGTPQPYEWVHPFTPDAVPTTSIPCRVDTNKSQAPEKLKNEIVIVDQYWLELPHNFFLKPTDIVHVLDRAGTTHKYRIMKSDLQGELGITNVALIVELDVLTDREP